MGGDGQIAPHKHKHTHKHKHKQSSWYRDKQKPPDGYVLVACWNKWFQPNSKRAIHVITKYHLG